MIDELLKDPFLCFLLMLAGFIVVASWAQILDWVFEKIGERLGKE